MQRNGIEPDDFTLGSVISSCANLASLEEGAQFHCRSLVSGLISFITVSNAIVTLYGKCGSIEDSHQLFNEMQIRDQVSWTALVSGYAQFGKAKETIELFEKMLIEGVKPDGVTFICVLSACSRAGLVEKGYGYFNSMLEEHGITPIADHYTCMIDLLSRAGRLKEIENFIKQMSCLPDAIGWATLLSSCRVHGNMELGKWAAEKCNDGCSWIKYKNKVYIFLADDQSHPYSDRIYAELEKLHSKMVEEGYRPDMSSILHDIEEAEKMNMLSPCHQFVHERIRHIHQ